MLLMFFLQPNPTKYYMLVCHRNLLLIFFLPRNIMFEEE